MNLCKQCNNSFPIDPWDRQHYEQMQVPEPTLCPNCRQQRRLTWRNERHWYRRPCQKCHKSTISMYAPESPYPSYCQTCWWQDDWDPLTYGQDFDFSRPFFEQYRQLQLKVPRVGLFNLNSENSEYTHHSSYNKNCYMGVAMGGCEECLYGHWILKSKNVIDALYSDESENCYEVIYCIKCYETFYSEYCESMTSCWFCFECKGCSNCIACTQLQHKNYHVLNREVSKEEFEKIKKEMLSDPKKFQEIRSAYEELKKKKPRRASRQINCVSCTGNDLVDCKNAQSCFNCHELEDCKYIFDAGNNKNGMDNYEHGWLKPSELIYECHGGMTGFNLRFCHICAESRDLTYCDACFNNCVDLFGCIGLKHKSYCILNKQYSKKDYFNLKSEIINHMKRTGEWGEFFPTKVSPFAYNETPAMEYFSLDKSAVEKRGWHWRSVKEEVPKVAKIIPGNQLHEEIQKIPDDILNWAIECEATKRLFRITAQELKFYRQYQIHLPHLHPDERHRRRMSLRPPRGIWERSCTKCQKKVSSTYPPERLEKVYCEECYLKEVY